MKPAIKQPKSKYLHPALNPNYWDEMWAIAKTVAGHSKDPSTKVGCVASINKRVIGTGRNGFPPGFPDSLAGENRAMKLLMTSHAEANLISFASRYGVPLDGAEIFVTFPVCNDCAKLIISAGIKFVFTEVPENISDEWLYRWNLSKAMFYQSGVVVYEREYDHFYRHSQVCYPTLGNSAEKLIEVLTKKEK